MLVAAKEELPDTDSHLESSLEKPPERVLNISNMVSLEKRAEQALKAEEPHPPRVAGAQNVQNTAPKPEAEGEQQDPFGGKDIEAKQGSTSTKAQCVDSFADNVAYKQQLVSINYKRTKCQGE